MKFSFNVSNNLRAAVQDLCWEPDNESDQDFQVASYMTEKKLLERIFFGDDYDLSESAKLLFEFLEPFWIDSDEISEYLIMLCRAYQKTQFINDNYDYRWSQFYNASEAFEGIAYHADGLSGFLGSHDALDNYQLQEVCEIEKVMMSNLQRLQQICTEGIVFKGEIDDSPDLSPEQAHQIIEVKLPTHLREAKDAGEASKVRAPVKKFLVSYFSGLYLQNLDGEETCHGLYENREPFLGRKRTSIIRALKNGDQTTRNKLKTHVPWLPNDTLRRFATALMKGTDGEVNVSLLERQAISLWKPAYSPNPL